MLVLLLLGADVAGVQSAMIQWWYGHNAVGFFLTAGFLGIMYYFIPKQANRPVYSYRLSIVHFWTLIFLYIWAGPHHLHYTALPDWAQCSAWCSRSMLWMPSWGGMINGLMTSRVHGTSCAPTRRCASR
jgi:cytochrome c oxidase cbb3-type subunit I